ncbi:TMEM175 family protein [Phenylobacterium sp.]|uniref:TMEM175 family protein n=1 Tax=Phenylobacterium sp. TaxID=1871053 RepID=UPI00286C35FB|nr:TMEM175 family protein [Phenylobacterium sp.]
MTKDRLTAFTDGVMAVIITIMVLELKAPGGVTLADLRPVLPVFLSYVLSFIYIGIYWNSHHHLLQLSRTVNGAILWANLHLLFWLSVIPFVTSWVGENPLAAIPVALYGVVFLLSGISYTILTRVMTAHEGSDSDLARAIGRDLKGKTSLALYGIGIALAFLLPVASLALYVAVAMIWFIPDRRVERVLGTS